MYDNRFKLHFTKRVFGLLMVCCGTLFSSDLVLVNYSSVITVNSFLMSGDTLFAASSGGLQVHNVKSGATELLSNAKMFPDPNLTALCRDANGNLWIGSQKGYLYKRTPRGQFTIYSNYKLAGWGILCLYTHGELIVAGSNKGVSLFDPQKGMALKNAAGIGDFSNPRVNTVTVFKDTLFLGCEEGTAYLDGLNKAPLSGRNFYDAAIWKTKKSGAPILSFINEGNSVSPESVPSAIFHGRTFTALDSIRYNEKREIIYRYGWILNNGQPWKSVTPYGKIISLYNENDKRLWIGTDEMYYFSYNGYDEPQQHKIEGLALRNGTRIFAAANGNVWALPNIRRYSDLWFQGIYRYDGRNWHLYNQHSHGWQFGYIGEGAMFGFAQSRDGTVWVGTGGGNIKHIDPVKNTVNQLVVGYGDYSNVNYIADGVGEESWGMVNALAADSAGFIWISVYEHKLGSLICYDPRYLPVSSAEYDPPKAYYRRFFTEPPLQTDNISEICVDRDNRIFVFDEPQSRLTVLKHNGSPLANGIEIIGEYPNIGKISAIRSAPDGATYLVGTGGLKKFAAASTVMETVDNTLPNITSLAIQENVLWLGTTDGILRYGLADNENKKRWINESSGLLSNNVLSLSMDSKNGYLWILTDEGVSRLDAGREVKADSKEPLRVFPNVFSIGGRTQGAAFVTFARLDPRSVVSVYTVNGTLVSKVDAQYFTDSEWRAFWTPKRTLAPGTYFAVVKPSGKKAKIILKP
ncbi:MAG: hypothetical protein LBB56_05770 [Chitinispirillales bacterium]|nr:hypothetical protein [Chitinispirillales bacterium]